MDKPPDQISFRVTEAITGGFVVWVIIALGMSFVSYTELGTSCFVGFFALIIFVFSLVMSSDEVKANSITRILTISRTGFWKHYRRDIPFDEIKSIYIETHQGEFNSTDYLAVVALKDGDIQRINTQPEDKKKLDKIVQYLVEFINADKEKAIRK